MKNKYLKVQVSQICGIGQVICKEFRQFGPLLAQSSIVIPRDGVIGERRAQASVALLIITPRSGDDRSNSFGIKSAIRLAGVRTSADGCGKQRGLAAG